MFRVSSVDKIIITYNIYYILKNNLFIRPRYYIKDYNNNNYY